MATVAVRIPHIPVISVSKTFMDPQKGGCSFLDPAPTYNEARFTVRFNTTLYIMIHVEKLATAEHCQPKNQNPKKNIQSPTTRL